jgi:hypothetical protein
MNMTFLQYVSNRVLQASRLSCAGGNKISDHHYLLSLQYSNDQKAKQFQNSGEKGWMWWFMPVVPANCRCR